MSNMTLRERIESFRNNPQTSEFFKRLREYAKASQASQPTKPHTFHIPNIGCDTKCRDNVATFDDSLSRLEEPETKNK